MTDYTVSSGFKSSLEQYSGAYQCIGNSVRADYKSALHSLRLCSGQASTGSGRTRLGVECGLDFPLGNADEAALLLPLRRATMCWRSFPTMCPSVEKIAP